MTRIIKRGFFHTKRKVTGLLVFTGLIFVFLPWVHAQENRPYRVTTVVIDPGHGGRDPGALGKRCKEKDIALAISLKLGKYIEQNFNDVKVIYTRDRDVFVELDKRAEIANGNNADLFISIHANGLSNSRVYGAETFVMGLHTNERNLEIAMKENAVITLEEDYTNRYQGYDPHSAESFIIFNLMQNKHLEQSLHFASYVQNQFSERARRYDRGVKQAGFIVLWMTTMPSALIEVGFVSNPQEEAYLMSEQGQDYLASAIFRAFRDYKHSIESREEMAFSQAEALSRKEIRYKVQVAASGKRISLDHEMFRGFSHVEEFTVNGLYKYAVGEETDYRRIVEYSQSVKERFPDAFVIAVRDTMVIPLSEALRQTE